MAKDRYSMVILSCHSLDCMNFLIPLKVVYYTLKRVEYYEINNSAKHGIGNGNNQRRRNSRDIYMGKSPFRIAKR